MPFSLELYSLITLCPPFVKFLGLHLVFLFVISLFIINTFEDE